MSHHSSRFDPEAFKDFEFLGSEKPGPTGLFPEGKLTEDDQGEIAMAVGHKDGKVIIEFGTPVAWVGMNPIQAKQLAMDLLTHATEAYVIKREE